MTERIDPYRFPGVDLEKIRDKTPAEQQAHIEAERAEWERKRPLEIARLSKRSATVAAGGSAEAFDKWWKEHGEQAAIREEADRREQRARRESSVF